MSFTSSILTVLGTFAPVIICVLSGLYSVSFPLIMDSESEINCSVILMLETSIELSKLKVYLWQF